MGGNIFIYIFGEGGERGERGERDDRGVGQAKLTQSSGVRWTGGFARDISSCSTSKSV